MKTVMKIMGATIIYAGMYILMTIALAIDVLFVAIRAIRLGFFKFVRTILRATRPMESTILAWDDVVTTLAYRDVENASDTYGLGFYSIGTRG